MKFIFFQQNGVGDRIPDTFRTLYPPKSNKQNWCLVLIAGYGIVRLFTGGDFIISWYKSFKQSAGGFVVQVKNKCDWCGKCAQREMLKNKSLLLPHANK